MKKKGYKILKIVLLIVIIGAITFFTTKAIKANKNEDEGNTNPNKNENEPISEPPRSGGWIKNQHPLQKGMSGDMVLSLQQALNTHYKAKLAEDGKFGDKTLSAVRRIGCYVPIGMLDYFAIINGTFR